MSQQGFGDEQSTGPRSYIQLQIHHSIGPQRRSDRYRSIRGKYFHMREREAWFFNEYISLSFLQSSWLASPGMCVATEVIDHDSVTLRKPH